MTTITDVSRSLDPLINVNQQINGTLANVQAGQVWQKVVSHEEAQEDPIIDGTFQISRLQLQLQIFPEDGNAEKDKRSSFLSLGRPPEVGAICHYVSSLVALAALVPLLLLLRKDVLP